MSTKTEPSSISDKETPNFPIKEKENISMHYKAYLQVKYGKSYKYDLIKYGLCDESSSEEF
jgi:hypothetical protein